MSTPPSMGEGFTLIAGVFVDPFTGQIVVQAAPDVNPILAFIKGLEAMELARIQMQEKKPTILRAAGSLPK